MRGQLHLLLVVSMVAAGGGGQKKDKDDSWMNFGDFFLYGKDAYLANDWKDCVYYFEKAVGDYKTYIDKVVA